MVEFHIGRREQVGIVYEDGGYAVLSSNTMSNAGFIPGRNVRVEPDFTHAWQEILSAGDDSREVNSFAKGPQTYKFTMTFAVTDWRFLRFGAFGSVTNTGADPYTHTFTLKDDVTSFTMEWSKRSGTDHVVTLTGCVITDVTLRYSKGTGEREGFVEAVCRCVAKTAVAGTTTTSLSATNDLPFQFRMATLTLAGSEIVEVNNGEVTISNGISDNDSRYANTALDQEITEPIPTVARYTARFNINVKDDTFYDLWAADASLSSTNTLVLTRGANDTMTFTFTNFFIVSPNTPTNLDGVNSMDIISRVETLAPVAIDSRNDY